MDHCCNSLFLGCNEENGIRGIITGWKFDTEDRASRRSRAFQLLILV
jgi:hypothetical protein